MRINMLSAFLKSKMSKILVMPVLCLFLMLSTKAISSPQIAPENIRQVLLASAQASDPDLSSKNPGLFLTHFSHVCELSTDDGKRIYVADRRSVLRGMSSPRGLNFITFFAENHTYLGKFRYVQARPLWCEGGKLFLFGNLEGATPGGGNVIDVSRGFQNIRFYHEEAYGSSTSATQSNQSNAAE
jgi:hypothetical protein